MRPLTPDGSEIEAQVVALRTAGRSFEQIAIEAGLSGRSQAFRVLQRALRRHPAERVDDHRAVDLARLDVLTSVVWPRALTGDAKAVGSMLRIMERRARLLGLDRETGQRFSAEPSELDETADELLERIAIFDDLVDKGAISLPSNPKELGKNDD